MFMYETSTSNLLERITSAFDKIPPEKWIYFHRKSMLNFINHLSLVSPEQERLRIELVILEYITEVELVQDDDLGFVPVFGRQSYIYVIPGIILLLYLSSKHTVSMGFLVFLLIIYFGRILLKMRKRKIYGFGY